MRTPISSPIKALSAGSLSIALLITGPIENKAAYAIDTTGFFPPEYNKTFTTTYGPLRFKNMNGPNASGDYGGGQGTINVRSETWKPLPIKEYEIKGTYRNARGERGEFVFYFESACVFRGEYWPEGQPTNKQPWHGICSSGQSRPTQTGWGCKALTAACKAQSAGLLIEEYCVKYPSVYGCPFKPQSTPGSTQPPAGGSTAQPPAGPSTPGNSSQDSACANPKTNMGLWSFKDPATNRFARGGVTAEGRNDLVGALGTAVTNPSRAWESFRLYSIPGVDGGRRLQNTIDGRWLETVNNTGTLMLHGPARSCNTSTKDMQWRVVPVEGQRGYYKLQNLGTNQFVKVAPGGLLKANATEAQATAFIWNKY